MGMWNKKNKWIQLTCEISTGKIIKVELFDKSPIKTKTIVLGRFFYETQNEKM